jgi:FolB domain-containing protein
MRRRVQDKIQVEDIRIQAIVGLYPHERKRRQPILVSLEFPCDAAKAGARDRIGDAVDYDALARHAVVFGKKSSYFLIETLADRMAAHLLEGSPELEWLRLTLVKPGALKSAKSVRLQIYRERPARPKSSKD